MDKYKIPNVKTFEYTKIIGLENIEYIDYQTGDAYSILSLPLDKYI